MKVAIRVDASIKIGSGHVMRCLTLAEALRAQGADVLFLCRPHTGNLIATIEQRAFPVHTLECGDELVGGRLVNAEWLGASQQEDAQQCMNALENNVLDWIVVDHYGLDATWEANMKHLCHHLMVIDDLGDRDHQCDLLLDQNYGSAPQKYHGRVPANCMLLVGSEYALLRPEFLEWRVHSLRRRESPKLSNIMISLGGVDASNVTLSIIKQLSESTLPRDVKITVVMGPASPHVDSVKKAAADSHLAVDVKTNILNMAELMANADLAIGAAGSSSWERCCLGLPSVQFILAENQRIIADALADIKAIRLLHTPEELPHVIEDIASEMPELSRRCAGVVDGRGVERVRDVLLTGGFDVSGVTLTPYTSLNSTELAMVLEMRNHDAIRKWMRHTEKISWEEHLSFTKALAGKADRIFLLARRGDDILGTVNFIHIDQMHWCAELGIYANPLINKPGNGSAILRAALTYARSRLNLSRIRLEVAAENIVAMTFYQKFGFQKALTDSSTDFITMEKHLADED